MSTSPAQFLDDTQLNTIKESKELIVSEAASLLGISTTTLRNYESEGLITSKRKDNGYRVYLSEDVMKLKKIVDERNLIKKLSKEKNAERRTASRLAHVSTPAKISETCTLHNKPNKFEKLPVKEMMAGSLAIISLFLMAKTFSSSNTYKGAEQILGFFTAKEKTTKPLSFKSIEDVLADTDYVPNYNLDINVPTSLKGNVDISKNLRVSGIATISTLNGVGGIDRTTADTFERTLNINGDVTGTGLRAVTIKDGILDGAEFADSVEVSGDWNFAGTLSIDGTQLEATGDEINLLSGLSGPILDSSTAADELAAWDQDSSNDWILTGNAGLATTAFLGTTDAKPLIFKTNNIETFRITEANKIGIGTSAPTSLFSVGSNSQFQIDTNGNLARINNIPTTWPATQGGANQVLQNDGTGNLTWGSILATDVANDTLNWSEFSDTMTLDENTSVNLYNGTASKSFRYYNSNTSSEALYIDGTNGRIGIGTTAPTSLFSLGSTSQFQVNASGDIVKLKNLTYSWPTAHTTNGVLTNDGSGNLSWGTVGAGGITPDSLDWSELKDTMTLDASTTINMDTNTADFNFDNGTLYIDNAGYIGIGTTNPTRLLNIYASANPATTYSTLPLEFETHISSLRNGNGSWENPQNITISDNIYTSAHNYTDWNNYVTLPLEATGFDFSIPENATVSGIEVTVEKYAEITGHASVQDQEVKIIKNGTTGSTNRATSDFWSDDEDNPTIETYGSSTDLWGQTWTPNDINATNFGISITADLQSDDDVSWPVAHIDYLEITVYYTTSQSNWSSGVLSSNNAFVISKSGDFSSNNHLTIKDSSNNGYIGIGTTNPTYTLDIISGVNNKFSIRNGSGSQFMQVTSNSSFPDIRMGDIGGSFQGTYITVNDYAQAIGINAYGSVEMGDVEGNATAATFTVDSENGEFYFKNGGVGIGTTNPTTDLDIVGLSSSIRLLGTEVDGGSSLYFGARNQDAIGYLDLPGDENYFSMTTQGATYGLRLMTSGATPIIFSTSGAEKMRISPTGNVGIGTTSPASALDIKGSSNATQLTIRASASQTNAEYPASYPIAMLFELVEFE